MSRPRPGSFVIPRARAARGPGTFQTWQKGLYVFEQNPRDLIDIQEDVLRENINVGALTKLEGEVLSILS